MTRTTPSSPTRTSPRRPFTFDTTFSLNQPGAQIATKVYVVLNTGNDVGSATMMVQRPF